MRAVAPLFGVPYRTLAPHADQGRPSRRFGLGAPSYDLSAGSGPPAARCHNATHARLSNIDTQLKPA